MRTTRREFPQVNAGSMADIAFLLLIFFLVTAVIPNDSGLNRKLPPICPPNVDCSGELLQKNTLEISVNSKNEIFIENEVINIDQLKDITKAFLDNNGDLSCEYCSGLQDENSSDNPKKAVISLTNDKLTTYAFYIKVQDEITKAYYELRHRYIQTELKTLSDDLTKEELIKVREAYPFILSEAELTN